MERPNYLNCRFDTHEKELNCGYYEESRVSYLGCKCKFMFDDKCYCKEQIFNVASTRDAKRSMGSIINN